VMLQDMISQKNGESRVRCVSAHLVPLALRVSPNEFTK
jgi:hypothetical protein